MKWNYPRLFNWLLITILIWVNFDYHQWDNKDKIIAWDIISYYGYLPATFIYEDLTLHFVDNAPEEVKSHVWYLEAPNGGRAIKTSMGVAYLYTPFFLMGHAYALVAGEDANGYTWPYKFALIVSCVFYLGLALYFLRKTLSRYFPARVVMFTIFVIVIGTNLFYYSTSEPTMSHAYSFFLFSAFIFCTVNWYENPNYKKSIWVGILMGAISLVRPTNAIIVLFFLLWNIKSFEELKLRVKLWWNHSTMIGVMIFFAILIWLPQCIYWKCITDEWWYYSYMDEGFFFNNPQIFNSLFSYRKGWLLYTPVMIFALLGIPILYRNCKAFFIPVLIFTLLNIYIISSWWCWWYGGGFGLRAYIESFAILAFPMASFVYSFSGKRIIYRIAMNIVFILLVAFYQLQNEEYRRNVIHWDSMSKEAYWASFLRLTIPENFEQKLIPPDYEKAKRGEN